MTRGARLLTLALVQSAVLAGLIGFRQWTLNTGTPVVLAIRPIDPRSLFQGDYVRLSYEIGHLRIDRLAGDDDLERGETVFVDLQPGRPSWRVTCATTFMRRWVTASSAIFPERKAMSTWSR